MKHPIKTKPQRLYKVHQTLKMLNIQDMPGIQDIWEAYD
jgi:hypothetical protein